MDQVGGAQKACGFVHGTLLAQKRGLIHLCSVKLLASLVRMMVAAMHRVRVSTTRCSHLYVLFVEVIVATEAIRLMAM